LKERGSAAADPDTSLAFILGCMPLWIATGAARWPVRLWHYGDWRMLAATGIAIFIIPALFVLVERLAIRRGGEHRPCHVHS